MTDGYLVACFAASLFSSTRWLRVAQREHYLAWSASRFAVRWWRLGVINPLLFVMTALVVVASVWFPFTCLAAALIVCVGPLGLGLKGRTSSLAWTRRLRTVAAVMVLFAVVLFLARRQ